MRFLDIFAGIGGFRYGLEQAGHEAVGHIEWDKFASKSYEAMYDLCPCKFADVTKNSYQLCKKAEFEQCEEVEYGANCSLHRKSEWYGKDIKSVTSGEIPKAEIWTFGFPCTDISISNANQRGLDGSRSGLFFEVVSIIKSTEAENRPQWLIAENVKNLLSIKGGRDFTTVLGEISELGYDLQWQVVNSKNFGVPQNRERVYIVGHLRGRSFREIFPIGGTNPTALAQIHGGSQGERIYNGEGLSITLTAGGGGCGGKCGLYTVKNHQTCASFIDYDRNGKLTDIARCVTARQNAGYRHHLGEASAVILCDGYPDCVRAVITPDRIEKRQNGRRFKEVGEPSFTLTCQDRHGVMFCKEGLPIHEAKKCGYTVAYEGDGINLAYPNSTVSRGRVGKQCAQTLMTGGTMGVLTCCRIRRLTPRECFRLQAFPDVLFDKAKSNHISDAQLYKQAGNAVTTSVVYEIGKILKEIEEHDKEGLDEI